MAKVRGDIVTNAASGGKRRLRAGSPKLIFGTRLGVGRTYASRRPSMSCDVVRHAEGQAQEVLGIGTVIGQAGAHVVGFEDADGEVFGDSDVPASAHLMANELAVLDTVKDTGKTLSKPCTPPNSASANTRLSCLEPARRV